ncbi:unnamed protein product, partial [Phaeothamnion confervicola]
LPNAACVAIDPNPVAVSLALRNAARVGVADRYACLRGSAAQVFAAAAAELPQLGGFDFIVSNPPYIPEGDMVGLPPDVVCFEDREALCGGGDGLDVVRSIVAAAPTLLRRGGSRRLWLEVDPSHPPLIERWL